MDSDKRTPLYRIDDNVSAYQKPQVRIYSGATNAEIGTIAIHPLIFDINVTIKMHLLKLRKQSHLLTTCYTFTSACTNQVYEWKGECMGWSGNMTCSNFQGHIVATYNVTRFAMKKEGRFEIMQGIQGALMDEVVVSASAILLAKRRATSEAMRTRRA